MRPSGCAPTWWPSATSSPRPLVVANKSVVEALKTAGLRNAVVHFGVLRGMNTWEEFNAIVVIGREQTSPVAGPGRALAARVGDLFTPVEKGNSLLGFDTSKTPAVVVSYLRPSSGGRGGSRAVFRALVQARAGDALAVLEDIVGPVEGFRIDAMNQIAALQAALFKPVAAPPSGDIHPAVPSWPVSKPKDGLPRAVGANTG